MRVEQDRPATGTGSSTASLAGDVAERRHPVVEALAQLLFIPWAGVLVGLIVISIVLSLLSPYFLTASNIFGTVAVYFSWICIAGWLCALLGDALERIGKRLVGVWKPV